MVTNQVSTAIFFSVYIFNKNTFTSMLRGTKKYTFLIIKKKYFPKSPELLLLQ